MKNLIYFLFTLVFLSSCNLEKKKEGELPELDIDVTTEAGELPEYEVNWADVEVGTTTKTVEIPKLVVVMEEEEVEVPYLDVDLPEGGKKEERTLMVEAEVTGKEHTIAIQEIWASGNTLYVISELTEGSRDIGDQKLRVSDQVTINAPDLEVQHYIIGERPDRVFNAQHRYIKDKEALKKDIDNVRVIYTG